MFVVTTHWQSVRVFLQCRLIPVAMAAHSSRKVQMWVTQHLFFYLLAGFQGVQARNI